MWKNSDGTHLKNFCGYPTWKKKLMVPIGKKLVVPPLFWGYPLEKSCGYPLESILSVSAWKKSETIHLKKFERYSLEKLLRVLVPFDKISGHPLYSEGVHLKNLDSEGILLKKLWGTHLKRLWKVPPPSIYLKNCGIPTTEGRIPTTSKKEFYVSGTPFGKRSTVGKRTRLPWIFPGKRSSTLTVARERGHTILENFQGGISSFHS